jgi:hypothetical protein
MDVKNRNSTLSTYYIALPVLLMLVLAHYTVAAKEVHKDTLSSIAQIVLADCDGTMHSLIPAPLATVFVLLGPECPISQQCTKAVNELAKSYTNEGIAFYGVIPGNHYTAQEVQAFKKTYHIPFVVLMDTAYALTSILHGSITPQAIVTDSHHRILYSGATDNAYRELGRKNARVTAHYLADALTAITHHLPIATPHTVPVGCLIATKTNNK